MNVKYRTRWEKIEPVEVERETASCVYIKGRRASKETSWEKYHDSWVDAHKYLIAEQEQEVASLRFKLESANGKLGQIKGMKPPKDAA